MQILKWIWCLLFAQSWFLCSQTLWCSYPLRDRKGAHNALRGIALWCQIWLSSCISHLSSVDLPLSKVFPAPYTSGSTAVNLQLCCQACNALTIEHHCTLTPAKSSPKPSFISLLIQLFLPMQSTKKSPQQAKTNYTNSILILNYFKLAWLFELTILHHPVLQLPQAICTPQAQYTFWLIHAGCVAASQGNDTGLQTGIPTAQAPFRSNSILTLPPAAVSEASLKQHKSHQQVLLYILSDSWHCHAGKGKFPAMLMFTWEWTETLLQLLHNSPLLQGKNLPNSSGVDTHVGVSHCS